jgi:lysine 6-dehydrogenase
MKVLTLGAGKVGTTIALELSKFYKVTSVDVSTSNASRLSALNPKIETIVSNISELPTSFYSNYDLVVSGVPGFLGYSILENVIKSKRPVVDISFMPEDPLGLQSLAKSHGTVAIVDAGLAPGISNLVCGHLSSVEKVDALKILVGGLPLHRKWPFQYKAPFSLVDVMEEYTRPARIKLFNNIVVRQPLTDIELINTEIGTVEGFYTDGVRTMLDSLPEVPTIEEKTLRYPGYAEYMSILISAGFFSHTPIEIGNAKIKPIDFTSKVLEHEFKLKQDDEDVVVMQVLGSKKGKTVGFELVDYFCKKTRLSAMSRCTGYTATACVELIASQKWTQPGIHLLEHIGKDEKCFNFILDYLAKRNVVVKKLAN